MKSIIPAAILLLLLSVAGCSSDNGAAPSQPPSLELRFLLTATKNVAGPRPDRAAPPRALIDSMKITRVRMILRNCKLVGASDSVYFLPKAKILDIRSFGIPVPVDTQLISTLRYYYFDVGIHVPEANAASLPEYADPAFLEFLEGLHYSMIVEGKLFDASGNTNFTFTSRGEFTSRLLFSPYLILQAGARGSVTIAADALRWFVDGQSGNYLNPIDPANNQAINTNILNSFHPQ